MSRAWRGGSTRQWRAIRRVVLADNTRTNGGRCVLQLPACTGTADQVHHVAGKAAGDDRRLLLACCAHCNRAVGDPQRTATGIRRVSTWFT